MKVSSFTSQNSRSYQEDRSFTKIMKNGEALLGVFDGHGSQWVAEYAADHAPSLFRVIPKATKQNPTLALETLFAKLVEKTKDIIGGSTACVVWVQKDIAHVAVLGDSMAIIRTADGTIWQSPEHNVRSNLAEAIAAENRGGKISPNGYLFDRWQIDGPGLQMSRALGDRELDRVLDRNPEIFHIPINEESWILLCSDGLIDPSHTDITLFDSTIARVAGGADAKTLVLENAKSNRADNSTAIVARIA